jgi:hypothetical protein
MILKKNGKASLPLALALVAISSIVLLGSCSSPTKAPVDTSEIVLLTPKGGEKFHVGDSLKVTWKLQGNGANDINAVDVELSPDNGKTWGIFISQSAILTGTAQWENFSYKIPSSYDYLGIKTFIMANDSQCLVRVEQYSTNDPNLISTTKTPFTILP